MAHAKGTLANKAVVEEEEDAEFYNASELAEMEAAVAAAERQVYNIQFGGHGSSHKYNGDVNGGYARGNGGDQHRHDYNGNGNGGYRRASGNVHQQNYYSGDGGYRRTSGNGQHYNNYNDSGNGGYRRASGDGHHYNDYNDNGNGGQAYNYTSYGQQQYGGGEVSHGQRQQEGGGHYNRNNAQQGYRGGQARRQTWQPKNTVESEAGRETRQKPEEQVVASASETDQKVGAVNGDAAPASGSENPTG